MLPIGTLANVATVLLGSMLGLFLHNRLSEGLREIVFQGLGLCTLVIGLGMALKVENPLILIFSVCLGAIAGEAARVDAGFESLARWVKKAVKSESAHFTDGLITAFLIFCVGPMTIVGAFDEGIRGDPNLLYTKAILDGFAALALASSYGIGVSFSVAPLFLYQFGLTLFGAGLQDFFSQEMTNQITATGGVLILGIGFNLLDIKKIRISNLLPALPMAVLLTWLVK